MRERISVIEPPITTRALLDIVTPLEDIAVSTAPVRSAERCQHRTTHQLDFPTFTQVICGDCGTVLSQFSK